MSAATLLRELSLPCPPGDRVKCAIHRAASHAGLSYWRAWDIWYGKARAIQPAEIERIETALMRKREGEARNEIHDLRRRLDRLERLLAAADADAYSAAAVAVGARVRTLGGVRRPSDSPLD